MSQSFNSDAFRGTASVIFGDHSPAVPHFQTATIASLSPHRMYQQGIRAVVFDKDNTITAPYVNKIYPGLETVMAEFREVFGENIRILSNSAGTRDDIEYRDAELIEKELGIAVVRHDRKKPEGVNEASSWFDCPVEQTVMIGDRLLTDTLFGNRAGMLTIHVGILTLKGDNLFASAARFLENKLLAHWIRKGIRAPRHPLESIGIEKSPLR